MSRNQQIVIILSYPHRSRPIGIKVGATILMLIAWNNWAEIDVGRGGHGSTGQNRPGLRLA